ncbi:hypothetical protein A5884_000348 [Enterococcus sp. 7D2_DIV0200]|nr:hypothetical protein A5884_000348 [Enterococcus sp. 7D2_DIV0200]
MSTDYFKFSEHSYTAIKIIPNVKHWKRDIFVNFNGFMLEFNWINSKQLGGCI